MDDQIGEISFDSNRAHWKIPYFFDIPHEIGTEFFSPSFQFKGRRWVMRIYPNGRKYSNPYAIGNFPSGSMSLDPESEGWFGMKVSDCTSWPNRYRLDVRLGIVGKLEKDIVNYLGTVITQFGSFSKNPNNDYCRARLILRSTIESNKDRIVPGGELHLFMAIENVDDSGIDATQHDAIYGKGKCTKISKSTTIEASTQTGEGTGKGKCTKISKSATVDTSTQTGEDIEINELQQDFKGMLVHGKISDVILKVKGREFKVHRCVLAARSPVLLDMMTHDRDAKRKNTDIVELPHFDPDIFSVFLNYLYTGNVENINSKNVKELFSVADSYKVKGLRKLCLNHIMEDISVDNFCDMLTLSLRPEEECLKEACTQFFAKNSLNIILTPKWKAFLAANPEAGNELFVKQLQMN